MISVQQFVIPGIGSRTLHVKFDVKANITWGSWGAACNLNARPDLVEEILNKELDSAIRVRGLYEGKFFDKDERKKVQKMNSIGFHLRPGYNNLSHEVEKGLLAPFQSAIRNVVEQWIRLQDRESKRVEEDKLFGTTKP